MVELVGVMPGMVEGDDEWPPDMDVRIAALDFADSVLSMDAASCSSFEPSVSTYDPSLSTDSLDSEQLRIRCENKKDDYKLTFADSGQWTTSTHLTTWGRIQYAQPLDEKVVSAPSVNGLSKGGTATGGRPSSLLIDFVGRHIGSPEGRRVDDNENEIHDARTNNTTNNIIDHDRWRSAPLRSTRSSTRMKRTFADLEEAPELHFLALPHETLALEESVSIPSSLAECNAFLGLSSIADGGSPPDSGLGCSGPVHIEDWPSLSVLLPKHVAEACAFFRRNTELLGGSNCIERSRSNVGGVGHEACTTCFRLRRRGLLHPPVWAHSSSSRVFLCDCARSEVIDRPSSFGRPSSSSGLRSRELAVVGLPVYSTARRLVEAVVEGVAVSIRGDGEEALSSAVARLLTDGLKSPFHPWDVVRAITAPGPATKNIYEMVCELSEGDRSPDAILEVFLQSVILDCSLECWLSYLLLKEKVLRSFYRPSSFLLSAPSAYRSLLNRLLESLQLLSIHDSKEPRCSWGVSRAARIPSDSRVPKSSSVPARLSPSSGLFPRRPSRIPMLTRPCTTPCHSRTSFLSGLVSPMEARVKSPSTDPSHLEVSQGEKVRVLSTRGSIARCARVRRQRGSVMNGVLPVCNLLID